MGLYGSPQLGPFRSERPHRPRFVARCVDVVTLAPLWRLTVRWHPLVRAMQFLVLAGWLVAGTVAARTLVRSGAGSGVADHVRAALERDATPTFTAEQQQFVAAIAQQQRDAAATAEQTAQSRTTQARRPELALIASDCRADAPLPTMTCRGSVRNVTERNLQRVEIIIEWSDTSGGETEATSSASIDYDPLLPNQTSTWTVVGRYNPALRWYGIKARAANGDLAVADQRQH